MPRVTVPEVVYQRLAARAAALHVSIDDLVQPALDRLAEAADSAAEPPPTLTGDAWLAEIDAWKQDAERGSGRYPPGFILDDGRETLYREREDAQL